jgi:hypothetical protein
MIQRFINAEIRAHCVEAALANDWVHGIGSHGERRPHIVIRQEQRNIIGGLALPQSEADALQIESQVRRLLALLSVCSSCSDACGNQLEVAGEIWAGVAGERRLPIVLSITCKDNERPSDIMLRH